MKQFLPAFSPEESEKYDFLTNKNSEYLLYNFDNWTESLNVEKNQNYAFIKGKRRYWPDQNLRKRQLNFDRKNYWCSL